jgi:hypothetical protein
VRVVVGCQIDCVIVNPKVSALKIVSSIVSVAVVQAAMTFTMKLREPVYEKLAPMYLTLSFKL